MHLKAEISFSQIPESWKKIQCIWNLHETVNTVILNTIYVQKLCEKSFLSADLLFNVSFSLQSVTFLLHLVFFQFLLSAKIFSRWCINLPNGNQYKYLKRQMDDRINKNPFYSQKNPIVLDKLWENISLIENINQKYLDLSVLNQVFSENV